ncbi:hypothetical protein [Paraglaciecola sp. 25GB23A]|uniref:hypothetical protein n=1 Tax=Paraglaciecola sp. 25GB23A TaxID=3156068 RepID=UPI0032B01FA7
MNDFERKELIEESWKLHNIVESNYLSNTAKKGDEQWLEKQRILLADMAIHLFQSAVKPGELEIEKLTNNIHAILTIADQFIPHAELKNATEKLYQNKV